MLYMIGIDIINNKWTLSQNNMTQQYRKHGYTLSCTHTVTGRVGLVKAEHVT